MVRPDSLTTIGGTIHLGSQCAFHISHFFITTLRGICALIVRSQYKKKSLRFVYLPSILLLLYRSKAAVKEECLKASLASKQAHYFSLFGIKQALTFCLLALPVQFIYPRQYLILFIFQDCAQ